MKMEMHFYGINAEYLARAFQTGVLGGKVKGLLLMKTLRNTAPGLDFSYLGTWEKIPALSSYTDYVRPTWENIGRKHDLKRI